jgi:multidrug efflux pump subunit AcrA (membrane-fusion protein)
MNTTVTTRDLLQQEYVGQVARVIYQGDEQAHTFPVKGLLTNDDRRSIKPGMFASCMFSLGREVEKLLVPRSAIVQVTDAGGGTYDAVYRIGPPPAMGPPGGGASGGPPETQPAGPPAEGAGANGPPGGGSGGPPLVAYRTPVLLGAFHQDYQEIVSDRINPGDRVVVRGNPMLANIPAPMLPVKIQQTSDVARKPAPPDQPATAEDAPPAPAVGRRDGP